MHNRDPIAQSARTSWDQTFPRRLAASSSLSHRLRSPARLDKEHRLSRQRQTAKGITLSTPHLLQAPNVVFETQHLAASAARPSCNCRRHIHQQTRGRRTRLRRLSGEQEFFPTVIPKAGEVVPRSLVIGLVWGGQTQARAVTVQSRSNRERTDQSRILQFDQLAGCRTPAQAITRTSSSGCSSNSSKSSSPLHDCWWC